MHQISRVHPLIFVRVAYIYQILPLRILHAFQVSFDLDFGPEYFELEVESRIHGLTYEELEAGFEVILQLLPLNEAELQPQGDRGAVRVDLGFDEEADELVEDALLALFVESVLEFLPLEVLQGLFIFLIINRFSTIHNLSPS